MRYEPFELPAGAVDHSERRIARVGQLGGDPNERPEDGVKGQLGGDRNPGLDKGASSVMDVHAQIQHVYETLVAVYRQTSR